MIKIRIKNYLKFQSKYDESFLIDAYNKTIELPFDVYLKFKSDYSKNKTSILVTYNSKDEFIKYAKHFGIMSDFKAGVPRTSYKGIVRIYVDSSVIYIAPVEKYSWLNYPKNWR